MKKSTFTICFSIGALFVLFLATGFLLGKQLQKIKQKQKLMEVASTAERLEHIYGFMKEIFLFSFT